jgi:RNA polymerase sigma-70 factor (ECF subfamily)
MSSLPVARRDPAPELIATVKASLPATTPLEESFEQFYSRVRVRAVSHAELFIGYDAAQDAVQAATMEIWERWPKMHPEERTDAWFLAGVHFRVIDELRRRRSYVELTDELEEHYADFPRVITVAESNAQKDLERWVDQMIDGMPLRRKEIWSLVRGLGFTYEQAGKTLGISPRTVEVQLRLARDYFLKGLTHGGVELSDETIMKLLPPSTETSHE